MKALLAEKPSVAADLAHTFGANTKHNGYFEGNGLVVTWAFGHLLTAANPDDMDPAWGGEWNFNQLPMLPDRLTYKLENGKRDQFKIIKDVFSRNDVDEIVCCTDAGREGELIFRLIYEHAGTRKSFTRLWTSSLTPQALKDAFAKRQPGHKYDNLGAAASTRALADWIFGMNLTRAYTVLNGAQYRVGRVKTPTLAMVVERDREIEAFQSKPFYEILVTYREGFTGKYTFTNNGETTTRLLDPKAAGEILNQIRSIGTGTVRSVTVQKKTVGPPPLYNLLNLQRDANQRFGFTAAQTLEIAQDLYEKHKLITYPRTESNSLPTDMVPQLGATLKALPARFRSQAETALTHLAAKTPGKPYIDDAKLTDHHAIIPDVHGKPDQAQLSDREAKLYDLIAMRFVTMFYPDHIFNAIVVETMFASHLVVSRGKEILQAGWKTLTAREDKEAATDSESDEAAGEGADDNQTLPSIKEKQTLHAQSVDRKDGKTTPPKYYTDATLLTAMKRAGARVTDETLAEFMKHAGIGTPATRAQIIEDLLDNQLLTRVKKQLHATPSGHLLVDQVLQPIKDPTTTALWEQQLSNIEAGSTTAAEFVSRLRGFMTTTIGQVKETTPITDPGVGECPACKTGRIRCIKDFYGCTRYREGCKFTLPGTWSKKRLALKHIQELLTKRKTSLIKGFVSASKGTKYDAFLELDDQFKIKMSFPPR